MFKLTGWHRFWTLKLTLAFLLLDSAFSVVNDPCRTHNYQTLSEAWRNVNQQNDGSSNRCDSHMNGEWYRFVGAAGDRMPTKRPPSDYRCGTVSPMWMDGAHPSVADGVVSRQSCAYRLNDPCRWSKTILVKACGGGFYLYQLRAPPSCYLAYCGVHGAAAAIDCTNDYMQVELPRDTVGNLDGKHLHWEPDRRCGATSNGTHIRLRTGLYECGTQVEFTPDDVIFSNRIVTHGNYTAMLDGVITRGGDVDIPVRCVYPRKELVHTSFRPAVRTLRFTERGVGALTLRLDAFPTQQFLQPYGEADFPLSMALRSDMFLQLQAEGHQQDGELSVLAETCMATPSMNPNDQHLYALVENGCPKDASFHSFSSPNPAVQRFGFQIFRFVDDQPVVYVHCEVVVCNASDPTSRCAQGCSNDARSKRALPMTGRHFISQGPLVYHGKGEKGWGPVTSGLLAVGGFLCGVLLMAVAVAIRKRQQRPLYHAVPTTESE